ncbi:hypothetical protein C8J57DRAFT_1258649 [Mycena rebaudengoi]|nr:hypothetical protein C8J57DRAFT_1258649 [Mycena rebaudengoi]
MWKRVTNKPCEVFRVEGVIWKRESWGVAETLAGMSGWVQEMTMVFERLSGERAIQDSTVVVTLEALAKATEDLRGAREEARNNPQTVTAGTGSGTVHITTKQPCVAAPLVFKGDAEKVDQLLVDCWLNFQGNSAYNSEQAKITYCLSYMKEGGMAMWANNVVLALQKGSWEGCYTTWESFKEAVISDFKGGAQPALPIDYAGWKSAAIKHDGMHHTYATVNASMRIAKCSNRPTGFTGGFGAPNQNVGFSKKPDFSKMVPAIQAPSFQWTLIGPPVNPLPTGTSLCALAVGKKAVYLAKNPQFQVVFMDAVAKQDEQDFSNNQG